MQRICSIFLAVLLGAAVACGGDDASDDDTVVDASTDTPADGSTTTSDASSSQADAGATEGIVCGDQVCDEVTQECCLEGGQTCVDIGTCQGTTFGCDGPEDCPVEGETCCGMGEGAHCQPASECTADVCHTSDDCPDSAPECCPVGGSDLNQCMAACPGA